MVVLTYNYFVESRGAWVQAWAYLGRGLRVQSLQMKLLLFKSSNLKKQYNTMSCHEANQHHRRRLGGSPGTHPGIIKMGAKPLFLPPNNQTRILFFFIYKKT